MDRMKGRGYVASFIGHEAGRALFVGLYWIAGSKPLTYEKRYRISAFRELRDLGMAEAGRRKALWFDLRLTDFYAHWKGRLIVGWPPPERSWWRRADNDTLTHAPGAAAGSLSSTESGCKQGRLGGVPFSESDGREALPTCRNTVPSEPLET